MEKSFGAFLRQKRLEKNLTQKQLSSLLFVSESAVSKWEKGVSYPDITLLPKLSEILGVSEHELITSSIDDRAREEKVQAKKWRAFSMTWSLFFYISYCVALITCFICNLAINKTLSWFWIVFFALIFAFTFTNLPKLIKKHKLIMIPLWSYFALCLLLGACCIYTKGSWFFVVTLSVLLGLIIIFTPICIVKFSIFNKIRRYTDFVSVGVDFILLNVLLIVIDGYTITNWYLTVALPIVLGVYLVLNLLLSVRFLKVNKLLKSSIILFLINFFAFIPPLIIKVNNPLIQKEIEDLNVFKANFLVWQSETTLDNNISCILCLAILCLAIAFLISGLIVQNKRKK